MKESIALLDEVDKLLREAKVKLQSINTEQLEELANRTQVQTEQYQEAVADLKHKQELVLQILSSLVCIAQHGTDNLFHIGQHIIDVTDADWFMIRNRRFWAATLSHKLTKDEIDCLRDKMIEYVTAKLKNAVKKWKKEVDQGCLVIQQTLDLADRLKKTPIT